MTAPVLLQFLGAPPEILIILLVLVLLFGANKIPKLARSTGEAMGEFKKGRQEIEEELSDVDTADADASVDEPASDVSVEDDDIEPDDEQVSANN